MPRIAYDTAPRELADFLRGLTDDLRASFADELVAVVLHGSLAMASFYPPKSDIDLLVVVSELTEDQRVAIYALLARWQAKRPYLAGLEASVLREADAQAPTHPIPFLVHLGDNTKGAQARRADGSLPVDPDLAGHFLVARTRGVSLFGPPPDRVIGEAAWEDYLASVTADLRDGLEGEAILASPRYAILNLCRWALMQATGQRVPASKEEGGVWALEHAPAAQRAVIAQALAAYRSDEVPDDLRTAGGPWDRAALLAFRDWARALPGL